MTHNYTNPDRLRSTEERLAETLARRQTPEFTSAGQRLIEQRQATERAAKEAELTRRARLKWEAEQRKPVSATELQRAVKSCNAAIKDAGTDMGLPEEEWDTIAYDVITNQCVSYRPLLAAEVKRVTLGILPEGEDY